MAEREPTAAGPAFTRRGALRGAAIGGGAIALSAALPAIASAQGVSESTVDFVREALELEQATAFAYADASNKLSGEAAATFTRFAQQEGAQADAMLKAFELVSSDDPPSEPADAGDTELLDDYAEAQGENELITVLAALEQQQVTVYLDAVNDLDSPDLVTSAAELTSVAAQHLAVLRTLAGDPPAEVVPDAFVEPSPPDSATDPDASSSDGADSSS